MKNCQNNLAVFHFVRGRGLDSYRICSGCKIFYSKYRQPLAKAPCIRFFTSTDYSTSSYLKYTLCAGEDLNLHGLLHQFLRLARLPITPPAHTMYFKFQRLCEIVSHTISPTNYATRAYIERVKDSILYAVRHELFVVACHSFHIVTNC